LISPFYALFNQNALFETAKSFRYFRYKGIEVRIQQSTTPQIYGWVGYSTYPKSFMPLQGGFSSDDFRPNLSFDDAVLFDIAIQNDVRSVVPWRSPEQWCDWYDQFQLGTNNYFDLHYNRCALFWTANPVHVLQTTAGPTVTFVIFARFLEPELSGHIDGTDDYYGQSSFIPLAKSVFKGAMEASELVSDPVDYFSRKGPDDAFRDIVMPFMSAFSPEKSATPTHPQNDPDLRNNPYGSVTFSSGRYVAGTGTQIARTHDYSIRDIIRIPSAVKIDEVAYSDTLINPSIAALPGFLWGRIGYMSQCFRMWRGSIDYTIVFFSSPFISARFNIIVSWGKTAPTGTVGNEIVKDVTIRGTTIVHVTMPFLSPAQWGSTYWVSHPSKDETTPQIYIKVIEPPVNPGDVQCSIPYVVFERAGSDFEFRSLMAPTRVITPEEQYTGQMQVSRLMGEEVTGAGGIPPQPNAAEGERTILQLCQRWSGRHTSSTYSHEPFPIKGPLAVAGSIHVGVFDTISSLFCFWSGQIRIKASLASGAPDMICWHIPGYLTTSVGGVDLCQKPEDGMVNIDPALTKVLDCTSPFLADTQYLPVFSVGPLAVLNNLAFASVGSFNRQQWIGFPHDQDGTFITFDQFYISGGDDYTLYLPLPPCVQSYWPINGATPALDGETLAPEFTKSRDFRTKKRSSSTTSCTLSESVESS
jgi:hypothetical protein